MITDTTFEEGHALTPNIVSLQPSSVFALYGISTKNQWSSRNSSIALFNARHKRSHLLYCY